MNKSADVEKIIKDFKINECLSCCMPFILEQVEMAKDKKHNNVVVTVISEFIKVCNFVKTDLGEIIRLSDLAKKLECAGFAVGYQEKPITELMGRKDLVLSWAPDNCISQSCETYVYSY